MRRLRPVLVLLLTTTVGAAAIGSSAEGARRRATCTRAGSRTIVQNGAVRVYRVAHAEGSVMYACRKRTGRRMRLDEASDDGYTTSSSYRHVLLAGDRVAWISTFTDASCKADCPPGYEATTVRIAVADVATRRTRSLRADPFEDALVLSRDGGVAWAARGAAPGVTEIHASVHGTEDRLLDSGNIDPRSLAIEITIISWTRDGAEHFARLR